MAKMKIEIKKELRKEKDFLLEDIKLEEDKMFRTFLDEFEPELRKEFIDYFECSETEIEDVYPKEWFLFCQENFNEYLKDLEICK